MAQDDRVSKFVTAITKEAEEQRKRIEQETKDYIASEMEKAEMEALNDSYKMIQRAVANIRADVGSQLSSRMMENRRVLLTRRDEIADSVLTKAADKVKAWPPRPKRPPPRLGASVPPFTSAPPTCPEKPLSQRPSGTVL